MKDIAYYISNLASLVDNHLHSKLENKRVAVSAPVEPSVSNALHRVNAILCTEPGAAEIGFFDARQAHANDGLAAIQALRRFMRANLEPEGSLFAIVQTGQANHHFDVINCIVRTNSGVFPTQHYLFDSLLSDCSIRILDYISNPDPDIVTRLIRLTHKKPSLLLILGGGHSGKTSFARDLLSLDSQIHVSNDYIYCELQRLFANGGSHEVPQIISSSLGNGTGQACYEFNRKLDKDREMLLSYAGIIVKLLPRNKRLVTMDLDLQEPHAVTDLKEFLVQSGFSVWLATR